MGKPSDVPLRILFLTVLTLFLLSEIAQGLIDYALRTPVNY